ncbi:MAG: serine/threonine protein kinase [Planctomycetes bacterium]|nr:serine/threonine protein kinase [Planctomycetota bacterium]
MPADPRIQILFQEALELGPQERAAFLARSCAGDAGLRRELDELLAAHDAASEFLAPRTAAPPAAAGPEGPGAVLDRYQLVEPLGEGGFGVVWRALQTEPIRREVALKVLKQGMDTRQVVARFHAERQALAWMDHPNIARVLDAGSTASGRPYFVMELVPGVPITTHCDRERLPLAARLHLFLQVCAAVEHAHRKGVVHRDLKPGNVLVARADGAAVPKVIDFGIAKAIHADGAPQVTVTGAHQLLGTPEYMAPEQAGHAGRADVRTDVHGLGVVLYELLAGTTPYRGARAGAEGWWEVLEQVRHAEPPLASAAFARLGPHGATVADRRGVDARGLRAALRGDLDAILAKATAKDPAERYATAHELALDLERHLAHRPVQARAPSVVTRLGKFARRHRAAVAWAGVAGLAVLAGVVEHFWSRAVAERSASRAQSLEAEAESLLRITRQMLVHADPHVALAPNPAMRTTLDTAARQLEAWSQCPPETEAALRINLGDAYRGLALLDEAERHLRRALELRRAGTEPLALGAALWSWGWLRHDQGRYDEALAPIREALALARDAGDRGRRLAIDAEYALADLLRHTGDLDGARGHGEAALAALQTTDDGHGTSLPGVLNVLGLLAEARGDLAAARDHHERALAELRSRTGPRSASTAMSMHNLGAVLYRLGRHAEAEPLLRDAVAIRRSGLGDTHPHTLRTSEFLAQVLLESKQPDEAAELFASLAGARAAADEDALVRANTLLWLSLALRRAGRPAEAEEPLATAVALRAARLGRDHHETLVARLHHANLRFDQGRLAAAEAETRALCEAFAGPHEQRLWCGRAWATLGRILTRARRPAEAEAALLRARELQADPRLAGEQSTTLEALALLYTLWPGHMALAFECRAELAALGGGAAGDGAPR